MQRGVKARVWQKRNAVQNVVIRELQPFVTDMLVLGRPRIQAPQPDHARILFA
jgi:hypothetical protein